MQIKRDTKVKFKKYNIIIAVSLCLVTATSFASGFGVGDQDPGQGMTVASNSGASAALNQLMGQDATQNAMTGNTGNQTDARGTLSAAQIKKILAQSNQQNNQQDNNDASSVQQQPQAAAETDQAPAANDQSFGDNAMSQQAFANMLRSMMPLSPAQIKTLRKLYDNSQRAAATYPGTPPKPTSSSVVVNLSPGAAPPIVRLRNGFVTSLVFLDSTGQPWPIQAYDIGDPNSFNIQWDQKGNTLLVQSDTTYRSGNLAVMLKGKDTPVMVTLMPGQRAVDYRVDMRIPGLGPNASPTMSSLPDTANPQLINFLNGVPPQSAKELQVEGGPCQAWELGKYIYLRTSLTVLSPSWLASMSSPDGTNVYEITKAPVVLASFRGKVVQLTVQGY